MTTLSIGLMLGFVLGSTAGCFIGWYFGSKLARLEANARWRRALREHPLITVPHGRADVPANAQPEEAALEA